MQTFEEQKFLGNPKMYTNLASKFSRKNKDY